MPYSLAKLHWQNLAPSDKIERVQINQNWSYPNNPMGPQERSKTLYIIAFCLQEIEREAIRWKKGGQKGERHIGRKITHISTQGMW